MERYRNYTCEEAAIRAEGFVRSVHILQGTNLGHIGLILGTGWGDAMNLTGTRIPFTDIPGFEGLGKLEGHKRELVITKIAGSTVYVLDGRSHLNEAPDNPNVVRMVRLQTEMLMRMRVNTLIVTSAVGALPRTWNTLFKPRFRVGDICVVDGFVTIYAPPQPVWGGEFYSPEDTLTSDLQDLALQAIKQNKLRGRLGGHAMVQGAYFESRKYDKKLLAKSGARVVGMSGLPEACVAAVYGVNVLFLGFVTNDAFSPHSHEENQKQAKAKSKQLGALIKTIIGNLHTQ